MVVSTAIYRSTPRGNPDPDVLCGIGTYRALDGVMADADLPDRADSVRPVDGAGAVGADLAIFVAGFRVLGACFVLLWRRNRLSADHFCARHDAQSGPDRILAAGWLYLFRRDD